MDESPRRAVDDRLNAAVNGPSRWTVSPPLATRLELEIEESLVAQEDREVPAAVLSHTERERRVGSFQAWGEAFDHLVKVRASDFLFAVDDEEDIDR